MEGKGIRRNISRHPALCLISFRLCRVDFFFLLDFGPLQVSTMQSTHKVDCELDEPARDRGLAHAAGRVCGRPSLLMSQDEEKVLSPDDSAQQPRQGVLPAENDKTKR